MKKILFLAVSFVMALAVKAQSSATDVTSLLTNADFEKGTEGWDGTFVTQNSVQPNFSGTFLERWAGVYAQDQSTGKKTTVDGVEYYMLKDLFCSQTIKVDKAFYVLEAYVNAVQQNVEKMNPVTGVLLYANDDATSCATGNGQPELFKVGTFVTDTALTVGLCTKSTTANWIAWDNLKLTKYAVSTIEEGKLLWVKDELGVLQAEAEELMSSDMSAALRAELESSIAAIDAITTYADGVALRQTMEKQIADAKTSIEGYEKLMAKIEDIFANVLIDAEMNGYAELEAVVNAVMDKYTAGSIENAGVESELKALDEAVFAFRVANADGTKSFDVTDMFVTNSMVRTSSDGWDFAKDVKPGFQHEVAEFYDIVERYEIGGTTHNDN